MKYFTVSFGEVPDLDSEAQTFQRKIYGGPEGPCIFQSFENLLLVTRDLIS